MSIIGKRNTEGYWIAVVEKGGKTPNGLQGLYTKKTALDRAIALYTAAKDKPKRRYVKSRSVNNVTESKPKSGV